MGRRNDAIYALIAIIDAITPIPVTYNEDIGEYRKSHINITESENSEPIERKGAQIREPYFLDITIAYFGLSSNDAATASNDLIEALFDTLWSKTNLGGGAWTIQLMQANERVTNGRCVISRLTIKVILIYELFPEPIN